MSETKKLASRLRESGKEVLRLRAAHKQMRLAAGLLCLDLRGMLEAFEHDLRETMSNTNYFLLIERERKLRETLRELFPCPDACDQASDHSNEPHPDCPGCKGRGFLL